ncbi:MAG: hypothetical protein AAF529_21775 [Pseudomonadota bacterium]
MKRLFILSTVLTVAACGGGGNGGASAPPVNLAPTVQTVDAIQVDANQSTSIGLTLNDDTTAPDDLIVQVIADNDLLFPSGTLAVVGRGAQRSLRLSPAVDEIGMGQVRIRVTDTQGLAAEVPVPVNVDPLQRNATSFGRELAMDDELETPELINAIDFIDDAEDQDFTDLLAE